MIRRSPYTLCSNKTHGAAAGCYAAITIMYQLGIVNNGLKSILRENSVLLKFRFSKKDPKLFLAGPKLG